MYEFIPKGVCSRKITFDLNEGKISNLKFIGGCDGNLKAISKLVENRDAKEVLEILKGNTCGFKQTSCADQLSKAIKKAIEDNK